MQTDKAYRPSNLFMPTKGRHTVSRCVTRVTNSGVNAEIGKGGSGEGAFSSEADLIAESSDRFILRLLIVQRAAFVIVLAHEPQGGLAGFHSPALPIAALSLVDLAPLFTVDDP